VDLLCLTPRLTREQATAMLRQPLRQLRYGRLRLVMDFYIPFRMFRMRLENGKHSRELLIAADTVTGGLDPYQFLEAPAGEELMRIESSRCAPMLLSELGTLKSLKERMKREAFQKGFFKLDELKLNGELISAFYLPYWVGVYERNEWAGLEIIDAIRGRFEGAKLREIVTEWFSQQ
jgi:hypothetical protein